MNTTKLVHLATAREVYRRIRRTFVDGQADNAVYQIESDRVLAITVFVSKRQRDWALRNREKMDHCGGAVRYVFDPIPTAQIDRMLAAICGRCFRLVRPRRRRGAA